MATRENEVIDFITTKHSIKNPTENYLHFREVILYIHSQPNPENALKKLLDHTSPHAQYNAALYHIYSSGSARSQQEIRANQALGLKMLTTLIEKGCVDAEIAYANCLWLGVGLKADPIKALELLNKHKDHPDANVMLALHYQSGSEVTPKNLSKAFSYCEKLQENTQALIVQALCYMEGSADFPQDIKKGMECLQTAARKNDAAALHFLGNYYKTGYGNNPMSTKDPKLAFKCYERSSELGSLFSHLEMFKIYIGQSELTPAMGSSPNHYERAFHYASMLLLHLDEGILQMVNYAFRALSLDPENIDISILVKRVLFAAVAKGNMNARVVLAQIQLFHSAELDIEQLEKVGKLLAIFEKSELEPEYRTPKFLGPVFYILGMAAQYKAEFAEDEEHPNFHERDRQYKIAFDYLIKAIDNNHATAHEALIDYYRYGWGIPKDLKRVKEIEALIAASSGPKAKIKPSSGNRGDSGDSKETFEDDTLREQISIFKELAMNLEMQGNLDEAEAYYLQLVGMEYFEASVDLQRIQKKREQASAADQNNSNSVLFIFPPRGLQQQCDQGHLVNLNSNASAASNTAPSSSASNLTNDSNSNVTTYRANPADRGDRKSN